MQRALNSYNEVLDRLHLDGLVYPAIQMPPPDETMPQEGRVSSGPHSNTSWVNMIGVPAVVVPAGFYPDGLPFGLEISARPWKDGDLLGFAYAYEQATKLRRRSALGTDHFNNLQILIILSDFTLQLPAESRMEVKQLVTSSFESR